MFDTWDVSCYLVSGTTTTKMSFNALNSSREWGVLDEIHKALSDPNSCLKSAGNMVITKAGDLRLLYHSTTECGWIWVVSLRKHRKAEPETRLSSSASLVLGATWQEVCVCVEVL